MNRAFKEAAKRVVCPVLDGLGRYERRLDRLTEQGPVWLVLMYHRLVEDRAEDPLRLGMCTTTRSFREQMAYLKDRFEPIAVPEAVRRLQNGQPLPPLAVSVTFDDGYADFATRAVPILEEQGVPASIYVTTGGLAEGEPLWWDRVAVACTRTKREALDPRTLGLAGDAVSFRNRVERARACAALCGSLWQRPMADMLPIIRRLEEALDTDGSTGAPARLTPDAVSRLGTHPLVEVGAHTVRHPNMRLEDQQTLAWEIRTSREDLEALVNRPVDGFAYPGGYLNTQAVWAVREAGMAYGLSTATGLNRGLRDVYRVERMGAPDSGLSDFKRCVTNAGRAGSGPIPQRDRVAMTE